MIINWLTGLLLLGAVLSALVAGVAYRRRHMTGQRALSVLMAATSFWALCYGLEIALTDPAHILLAAKVSYLGIATVPMAWLAFAIDYTGHRAWLSGRRRLLLAGPPLVTLSLVATTHWHGLLWADTPLLAVGKLTILRPVYGPYFWLHVGTSYVALAVGTLLVVTLFIRANAHIRRQAWPLVFGCIFPWVANALFLLNLNPLHPFDLTPLAFVATGLAFAWCLYRTDLFVMLLAVVPVARDAIIESMNEGVVVLDQRGRVADLNRVAAELIGLPARAARNQRAETALVGWPTEIMTAPLARGQALNLTMQRDEPGGPRTFSVFVSPIMLGDRETGGRLVIVRETTIEERSQAALRASEERYRQLVENANDIIFSCDLNGRFTSLNTAGERLFGYSRDVFATLTLFDLLVPEHHERWHELLGQIATTQRMSIDDVDVIARDGRRLALEVSSRLVVQDGRPSGLEAVARDVSERRDWQATLTYQALHDSLTGLPNRTLLHERLQQALVTAHHHGQSLALLLIDLDRFKEVNDVFGHHDGDLLLRQIGPRLEGLLNETDTVARLGGDEFAVVLPGAEEPEAREVAEEVLSEIRLPFPIDGRFHDIGASVGIALYPDHGTDTVTLLRRADIAMYVAKRGRHGAILYAPEHEAHSNDRSVLINELRGAIEQGQLSLVFLPQVATATGLVERVEALVRWQHPQRGLLDPAHFLPLAEEAGLCRMLDEWVMGASLHAAGRWQMHGQRAGVSVNISAYQLNDPSLPDLVTRLLTSCGVAPDLVTLEVTERAMMGDPTRAAQVIHHLAALGIRVAIDDFGTGYSSLAYLKQLPISEIKIDRCFVQSMLSDDSNAALVRASLSLGHELGVVVAAEGVEDDATWQSLTALGCDLLQGHILGAPVPESQLAALLSAGAGEPWRSAPRSADDCTAAA